MNLFDRAVVGLLPLVPKPIVRRFSDPYIAGDNLAAAIEAIRGLNARHFMATLDVLGEFITRTEEAEQTGAAYVEALNAVHANQLDSNVSVKLTSLGLLLDKDLCFNLADRLVTLAAAQNNFVRIDMEDSACTTDTLAVFKRLRARHDNVGIVVQAYLFRTMDDIRDLLPLRPNVRVCKGIYVESRDIAWHGPDEIRENYVKVVDTLLENGCYVGIATHDEALVNAGMATVKRLGLDAGRYEFQMLLGVTEGLRQSIVDRGHRLRVYVPFGAKWYAYSVRRLKENPRVAGYVLKGLLGRLAGNGSRPH